jgi:hypothetical protein
MKKITLLFFGLLASITFSYGQVSSYSFSQSSVTYTPITGGIVLGSTSDDDQRFVDPAVPLGGTTLTGVGFPIGFNFTFNGFVYDRFAVNTNGWISFGSSTLTPSVNLNTSSSYTPLSSTSTDNTNDLVARVAALGRDLQSQTGGELRYELTGTTPNQVLVVQWTNYRKYLATGDSYNFQIKLYETSNTVEVVYGTMTSNATATTVHAGLRANPTATASNFSSRTSTTDWSASTASIAAGDSMALSATIYPSSGLTYTWSIPTCFSPTGILFSNITTSSATATWTASITPPANGYEYYYSTTNTAPTNSTLAIGSVGAGITTANLTSLSSASTYYFWIRSACSNSDKSEWTIAASFITPCASFTPTFTENFTTFPPNCWSRSAAGDVTTGPTGTETGIWVADGFLNVGTTGAVKVNLYDDNRIGWLISPTIDMSAGNYRVSFDYGVTTWNATTTSAMGSDDRVQLLASIDGGATWTSVTTFNAASNVSNTLNTFLLELPTFTSATTLFALYATDGTVNDTQDYDFFIDNFIIETIPTCSQPSALISSSITENSATISWTAPSTAPSLGYEYYYSTTNSAPTNATVPTGSVGAGITTANLTSLSSASTYYFWVRSVCSVSDSSNWSSVAIFSTPCAPSSVNYTQDFESAVTPALPSCTSIENAGTGNNWTVNAPNENGFTSKTLRYAWDGTNDANAWFYTNGINLTGGTEYTISYRYGNNSTIYTESMKVAIGTSPSAAAMSGNELADHPSITGGVPTTNTFNFTPISSGVYYFGFNAYSIADQFNLYLDDISITDPLLGNNSFDSSNFTYYPNPVKNTLNLSYNQEISNVEVFNLLGQKVSSNVINANAAQIDMSNLSKGAYMVKVSSNNQLKTIKVIKE